MMFVGSVCSQSERQCYKYGQINKIQWVIKFQYKHNSV